MRLRFGGRDRLQRDLETALQVEAQRRLLVQRRRRDRHQGDADESCGEQPEDDGGGAPAHGGRLRLAVAVFRHGVAGGAPNGIFVVRNGTFIAFLELVGVLGARPVELVLFLRRQDRGDPRRVMWTSTPFAISTTTSSPSAPVIVP